MNFLTRHKVRKVADGAAAATSAVTGSVVDMAGFLGVTFFARIATANAGNSIKVQHGDVSNLSDAADLLGTNVVCANDGEVVAVEVFRPVKRYLRAVLTRTASTIVGDMYAVQSEPRLLPVDNNVDSAIVSETHPSPAAGTA